MQKNENMYLKAITIRDHSDVYSLKEDIKNKIILILRITPIAQKDIEELRKVVDDLYSFAKELNGEVVRLGDERIIIIPSNVKIWKPGYKLK